MADSSKLLYESNMVPKATLVSLGDEEQMLLTRFNTLFGCIPISVGAKVVDIKKGKSGECLSIGFVKGMEGTRVTMGTRGRKGSTRNHFAMFDACRVVPHEGYYGRHLAAKYWIQVTHTLDGRGGSAFVNIAKCYVLSSAQQQIAKKREAAKQAKEKAAKQAKEKSAKQGKTKKPKEKSEAEAAQKAKEKAEAEAAKKAKEKVEAEAAKKAKQKAQKKAKKKTKKKAKKGSDSSEDSSSAESVEAASPDITLLEPRVIIRDLTLVRKFVEHFVDHLPDISHRPDIDPKSVQLWMKDEPNTLMRRRKSVKHPKRRYAATHSLLFGMCGKDTNRAIDFSIDCNYWCVTFEDEDGDHIDLVDDCIVCVWLHYMANNLVGCV